MADTRTAALAQAYYDIAPVILDGIAVSGGMDRDFAKAIDRQFASFILDDVQDGKSWSAIEHFKEMLIYICKHYHMSEVLAHIETEYVRLSRVE